MEVNGNTRIDSCLIVKDSTILEKPLHVKDLTIIDEKLIVKGNTVARENLRVVGNTRLQGNLKLTDLADTTLTTDGLLLITPDGKVARGKDVIESVYSIPENEDCIDKFGNPVIGTPIWLNGPGKIFTGAACPNNTKVGIQVDAPQAQLHIDTKRDEFTNVPALIIQNNDRKILELDNNGLLRSREIRVDINTWPDYVFEDDYNLMSLEETEKFIEDNGHLPNVPSAVEVESQGLNLAETDKILMEKTEELTLHLIELKKQHSSTPI